MLADLRRAFALLTILPLRDLTSSQRPFGRAMAFYPFVGAVIGGVLAGVTALLQWSDLAAQAPLCGGGDRAGGVGRAHWRTAP